MCHHACCFYAAENPGPASARLALYQRRYNPSTMLPLSSSGYPPVSGLSPSGLMHPQPVFECRSLYLIVLLQVPQGRLLETGSVHVPLTPAFPHFQQEVFSCGSDGYISFFQKLFSAAVFPCGVWCWGSNPSNASSMLGGDSSTELQLLKSPRMTIPFLSPQVRSFR